MRILKHTFVHEREAVTIPASVKDLASFRRWCDTEDCPEKTNIWWLQGEVWVDLSRQQLFTHVWAVGEFVRVLRPLVDQHKSGFYFGPGAFISNKAADIAGMPDGVFVSFESLDTKRVRLIDGAEGGPNEIAGSPDMVLEVVSDSSVKKDTIQLRQAYWQAGVREYWLVDARNEPVRFDILRHTPRGYVATRGKDGWLKSNVYGASFRVVADIAATPKPKFSFEMR
jgi:Uma2 family endonuclease